MDINIGILSDVGICRFYISLRFMCPGIDLKIHAADDRSYLFTE